VRIFDTEFLIQTPPHDASRCHFLSPSTEIVNYISQFNKLRYISKTAFCATERQCKPEEGCDEQRGSAWHLPARAEVASSESEARWLSESI
jgi:hypothetical protein